MTKNPVQLLVKHVGRGKTLAKDLSIDQASRPQYNKHLAPMMFAADVALLSGKVDRMIGMHAGHLRGDVGHVDLL